jgi:molybdenum cofactor cytidylyltransferase
MTITAIVLAAGKSSRFEAGNKLLADAGGGPLVRRVLTAVAESPVADIVLVTAPDGGRLVAAAGPGRWRHTQNPNPDDGLSSSIRSGLAAIPDGTTGALIVLADMPKLTAGLIAALITRFEAEGGSKIVYPISPDGRQGHPVLWPSAMFKGLAALTGDTGGKALLQSNKDRVSTLEVADESPFLDIDTRSELETYRGRES